MLYGSIVNKYIPLCHHSKPAYKSVYESMQVCF